MGIFSFTAEQARTSSEEAIRTNLENVVLSASREGNLEVTIPEKEAPNWLQNELKEAGYRVSKEVTDPNQYIRPNTTEVITAGEPRKIVRICW